VTLSLDVLGRPVTRSLLFYRHGQAPTVVEIPDCAGYVLSRPLGVGLPPAFDGVGHVQVPMGEARAAIVFSFALGAGSPPVTAAALAETLAPLLVEAYAAMLLF
jgi:hypothetical protein